MVNLNNIVVSATTPEQTNVLWVDVSNVEKTTLKVFVNGSWIPLGEGGSGESKVIGNLEDLVTIDKSNIVNAINEVAESSGGGGGLISITYAELKALRDAGNLVPGQQYRITDYECTTCQPDTRAVHHPFDIIVTANSVNSLDENARACLHEDDTYFADCNLSAWELKYSLDNDVERFAWASQFKHFTIPGDFTPCTRKPSLDKNGKFAWLRQSFPENVILYFDNVDIHDGDKFYSETGEELGTVANVQGETILGDKGVVYYMKDEFNNECPYDFKNMQFQRWWNEDTELWSDISGDASAGKYLYTFTLETNSIIEAVTDASLHGSSSYNCIMSSAVIIGDTMLSLNNNVLTGFCTDNSIQGIRSRYNTFKECGRCHLNSFCSYNKINNCINISLADSCEYNQLGESSNDISFDTGCRSNVLGEFCADNKFVNSSNNTFDSHCQHKILVNTSNKTSDTIQGTTSELWFNGEKKW